MNDLPLVLIGSLLGSAHCIGMCGGFALTIGVDSRCWSDNLLRQTLYGCGRIATYSLLGLAIGLGSTWLQNTGSKLLPWQAIFAGIAGVLLIVSGVRALGWRFPRIRLPYLRQPHKETIPAARVLLPVLEPNQTKCGSQPCSNRSCSPAKVFRDLLTAPHKSTLLVAGAVTGFLPCGLVYAFLTLAASRTNPLEAWLTMLVFGVGTLPLMITAGLSTQLFPVRWRRFVWKGAAVCLIISGVLSLWRGTTAWQAVAAEARIHSPSDQQPESPPKVCPFCK